ncbi:MAG: AraC-like DNA-binding protein [Flavobacteriaceae bacterium]|jgi:AraC-like DNA-binding protein
MELQEDILSISNIIAIVVSAFLALHFLFLKTSSWKANIFLGLFLLLTSLSVFVSELETHYHQELNLPLIEFIFSPILLSVILFYYVLASTDSLKTKGPKYAWMYVLSFAFSILDFSLISLPENDFINLISVVVYLTSGLISLVVLLLIMNEIKAHNKNILRLFSSIENKQLNWLKLLIIVNIGFACIWFIDDFLVAIIGDNLVSNGISLFSTFATLVTILWIGFAGLRQSPIFESITLSQDKEPPPVMVLDDELRQKYEALNTLIIEKRLYTDQDLTLSDLAKLTDLRPKELSMLINQQFESSFYHFINHHRVGHFKEISNDAKYDYLSIEGLSQEAGFKSKSTFYAAFKRIEGTTPKEYESRHNNATDVSRTS